MAYIIWTPQINTVKVSERQTNTQLNFSALLYVGLFFSVEYLLRGSTALHRGSSDLEGKKQVQNQRGRMISVTNFTRRLAETLIGLPRLI